MANWSKPETRLQAIDRLHRIGQKNAVSVIDIVMEESIDVTILRNLTSGIKMENRVLTGNELKGKA